jgi:DNA-binding NarL/FixJ family response regulator
MIKVVLADDQELVRLGLRAILESAGDIEVAGEASDGAEAVALARSLDPDVVLMDIRMPKVDGLTATTAIAGLDIRARVLVLTTFDVEVDVLEALDAGAAGFLLKELRPMELITAVRAVAAGGSVLAPKITQRLVEQALARAPQREVDARGRLDALSDREREVLTLVGGGLSNAEIAQALHMSPTSVKTYVSRMLAKLRLSNRTQAAILAYESGLLHQA